MPQKKQNKKTRTRKLGIDPTLKPKVVDTSHMANKKEQEDNPLGRMKLSDAKDKGYAFNPGLEPKLPEGFKTADSLTDVDDLKFELGRLREMLVSWLDRQVIDGVAYQVLADPMNRVVQIMREP